MTEREQLVVMLQRSRVSFAERVTLKRRPGHRQLVEVSDGSGGSAIFEFSEEGELVAFGIERNRVGWMGTSGTEMADHDY